MPKRPATILAINPGTKYLALAVFKNTELREWQIKTFKGKWSAEKMKDILAAIADFIIQYQIDALAIKRLHPSRSSANLNRLVSEIKGLVKGRCLLVCERSIRNLERYFCLGGRRNKRRMAEAVVLEYPVLFNEFEKEKHHKNPYYLRLFEAVALGSACRDEMDSARPVRTIVN